MTHNPGTSLPLVSHCLQEVEGRAFGGPTDEESEGKTWFLTSGGQQIDRLMPWCRGAGPTGLRPAVIAISSEFVGYTEDCQIRKAHCPSIVSFLRTRIQFRHLLMF